MYRVQARQRVTKELLLQRPEVKDYILRDLYSSVGIEMSKHNCFEITETIEKNGIDFLHPDEQEIKILTYVMTKEEWEEMMVTTRIIEQFLPVPMRAYTNRLYDILTKEPI